MDALNTQLANLESQLSREKINSSTLQVNSHKIVWYVHHEKLHMYIKTKVEELEEELHMKTDQVLHAFSRQNDLELEIASVRKDQQSAQENIAKLESDVCLSLIHI